MANSRLEHESSVMVERRLEGLLEVTQRLRTGSTTVKGYLQTLKARFSKIEPRLQAFLSEGLDRFRRLEDEARVLDASFPNASERPPLFGVPVGIKDIFHVTGFPTRAGSRLPPEVLRGPEARVVEALKEAGALVLGKSVTTEFAYFAPGPTRNPHNLGHTPGGSSSGSAASVASGLCPLALGSQTIGSVIRPAAFCGVVGFKPTYRRISLTGVIPLAPSADHVGYFCRDLGGAALVASILCHEWRDTEEEVQPALGIPEGPYLRRASEEGLAHFRETIDRLSDAGFEIRSVSVMSDFDEIAMRHHHLVAAEAAEVHREWFARFPDLYHPKTVDLIERGRGIAPDVLQLCRDSRHRLRESLQEIMVRQELSAWVAPSAVGPAPRGLDSTGDPVMNLPWTHAGLPVVNLPAGFSSNGLPLGLQVIGAWMRDEELMQLARDLSLECHPLQAVKECFIFWG